MNAFDLEKTPLRTGRTLIEASAGTGKTYTLAALLARLLIEQHLTIDQILVCTYTEPATAELRDRIRQMLREAALAFRGQPSSNFPFLTSLAAQHPARLPEVEAALRNVDRASIYTIHGFCQRLLQDQAFESGAPVETEVLTDESTLRVQVAEDFWRRLAMPAEPWLARLFLTLYPQPAVLQDAVSKILEQPEIRFPANQISFEHAGAHWLRAFSQTQQIWEREAVAIEELLTSNLRWANKPFNQAGEIQEMLRQVSGVFSLDGDVVAGLKVLPNFCTSQLAERVNKLRRLSPPQHAFFEACEELCARQTEYQESLLVEAAGWMREEALRRKRQERLIGYNDMLSELDRVLTNASAESIARLRGNWRAALIDEFQDTDPMQERIFRRLFAAEQDRVFLIGDPKQAIYGFRGANLQTYLRAAQQSDCQYSLGTNHRSEPALVAAVNALFGVREQPFGVPGIVFEAVRAREPAIASLQVDGASAPPLQLWIDDLEQNAAEADQQVGRAVAGECKRLLENATTIGEKRLTPGDIAVLTNTNYQAQDLQKVLQKSGIPVVIRAGASVFASAEAQDFSRLLAALADPRKEALLRAALCTPLLGWSAGQILRLGEDEELWGEWLRHFQRWRMLWLERNFMAMLQDLLRVAGTRERMLGVWDGERKLTNYLHLGELLHGATLSGAADAVSLRQWLEKHRHGPRVQNESWEQRLETDSAAVQILTAHSSKGLEFPVVFVPFAWKDGKLADKKGPLIYHTGDEVYCEVRAEERAVLEPQVAREKMEENLRLLYVAVTRARQRCYLAIKPGNIGLTSAIFQLLEQHGVVSESSLRAQFALCPAVQAGHLPAPPEGRYQVSGESAPELLAKEFRGEVRHDWRIASFTSLSLNLTNEEPDRDESPAALPVASATEDAAVLKTGPAMGTVLHEILERIDFQDSSEWPGVVRHALRRGMHWQAEAETTVLTMLRKVVDLALAEKLRLREIGWRDRWQELEFYFPIGTLTPARLEAVCRGFDLPITWQRLDFARLRGMLKGFMDLIVRHDGRFYLLDWKSNFLAPTPAGYHAETLRAAMLHAQYGLQYLLYCVALRRFLLQRVRGFDWTRDFGGVFYVFLRGIDPSAPEQGVFADRPPERLLAALDTLLA